MSPPFSNAMKFHWSLFVPALFILISCGSQPGPLTGNWGMSFVTDGTLEQAVAALTLHQAGDTVSGRVVSSLCRNETTLTGSLNGNSLVLNFADGNASGTLTGAVDHNFSFVSGKYSVTGKWCAQSSGSGTWSAVFLSN